MATSLFIDCYLCPLRSVASETTVITGQLVVQVS